MNGKLYIEWWVLCAGVHCGQGPCEEDYTDVVIQVSPAGLLDAC